MLFACASPPRAAAPGAGDCEIIRLWSNGFHTNIALRAATLGDDHPVRALFRERAYFLIGWGERDYYMATDATFSMGLLAIIPPSRSVVHVIAADEPVEERIWPGRDVIEVAISKEGAKRLAAAIADSIELDASGRPVIEGEGRIQTASAFLKSAHGFHLFNMCNHWSARILREAGVPTSAPMSFTAGGLLKTVRRNAPRACPGG